MIYPGAFEPYPRGTSQHCSYSATMSYNGETFTDVHLPSRYNLPFEHIRLTTSDNVKLHAYLLLHPAKSKRVSDKIDSPTSINSHSQQDVCVLGCCPCFFSLFAFPLPFWYYVAPDVRGYVRHAFPHPSAPLKTYEIVHL